MVITAFQIEYVGLSDIGHVRRENEDVWAAFPEVGLFVLADGMGGHQGGRIAAEEAVAQLGMQTQDLFLLSDKKKLSSMKQAFQRANVAVFEKGQSTSSLSGMGTTLNALALSDENALVAHVGDSRIYCLREGELLQLTEDHTLANEGRVEPPPSKHILSRAVGTHPAVEPAMKLFPLKMNDLFLLCSDGLTNSIPDREIRKVLIEKDQTLAARGQALLNLALRIGGRDNVTFILVHIHNDLSR